MNMAHPVGYPETPNLDKALEIKEKSQVIGEFMEWCNEKGWFLYEYLTGHEFPTPINETSKQRTLAEFFGIDYDAMNKEQDAVLKWHRSFV